MDDDDRDDHQSYHYETSDYDDETLKKRCFELLTALNPYLWTAV